MMRNQRLEDWREFSCCGSGEHLQSVFLHNCQELKRHTAGLLCASLPLFYCGFTGIEITRKDGLADMVALTQLFYLVRFDGCRHSQTRCVKGPHGGLVDRAHLGQRRGRGMNGLKGVTFEFALGLHCISPSKICSAAADSPAGP